MRALLTLALFIAPQMVWAQTQLSADDFDARTSGKTITYATPDGAYYGTEQYLDGRRVRWMYSNGTCAEGIWFPEGDNLCFLYEGQINAQCWIAEDRAGRIFAYTLGTNPNDAIGSTIISDKPLACAGPDLGV